MDNNISEFTQEFFNESSKIWRSNKKKLKNLHFAYKCRWIQKNKKRCSNICLQSQSHKSNPKYEKNNNKQYFCKLHINKKFNENIHVF